MFEEPYKHIDVDKTAPGNYNIEGLTDKDNFYLFLLALLAQKVFVF